MTRSIEPIRPLSPRSRWEAPRAPDENEERKKREERDRRERDRRAHELRAAQRADEDAPLESDADAGRTQPRTDPGDGHHIDVRA